MRSIAVCSAIAVLLFFAATPADARIVQTIRYQELFERSDLIVIARPMTKTSDTNERTYFANDIVRIDRSGKQSRVPAVGVETDFQVIYVLKGSRTLERFTLHHFREANAEPVERDGPALVSFDPSDPSRRREILLFLVRESDGRYAPYGGQTDASGRAIFALEYPR